MPVANPEFEPIVNAPFLYASGGALAWLTGGTTLMIADGQFRDSTNQFDMLVNTNGSGTLLDTADEGLNGLDVLPLQVSLYAVYIIADATGFNPTGFIASTNITNMPLMPFGYSLIRRIGWFYATNTGPGPLNGITQFAQAGNDNTRIYQYPFGQLVLAAGNATTFTPVSMANVVPPLVSSYVIFGCVMTAAAVSDAVHMNGVEPGQTPTFNNPIVMSTPTMGTQYFFPPAGLITGIPPAGVNETFNYAVDNAGDAVDIYVASYTDYL